MAYITPKTDWQSADYHNFADKNRVENNTDYVNSLLDFPATLDPIVTTRNNTYIDFKADFNRIASNIIAVKDAWYEPSTWRPLETDWQPVVTPFDYQVANDWERNIEDLKNSIEGTSEYFRVCGTFFANTNYQNLQRFSRGR